MITHIHTIDSLIPLIIFQGEDGTLVPLQSPRPEDEVVAPPPLHFDNESTLEMPARSRRTIDIHYTPVTSAAQSFCITWKLLSVDQVVITSPLHREGDDEGSLYNQCLVTGSGGYPTLAMVDIRSKSTSTSNLWSMCSVKDLNSCLSLPLDEDDITYNNMDTLKQKPELLKTFDISFPPSNKGSDPCTLYTLFKNTSNLQVDFNIKFPNDLEVEVEPWADAGEPSEGDLRQNAILGEGKPHNTHIHTSLYDTHSSVSSRFAPVMMVVYRNLRSDSS